MEGYLWIRGAGVRYLFWLENTLSKGTRGVDHSAQQVDVEIMSGQS